jgi:hypothetical protein
MRLFGRCVLVLVFTVAPAALWAQGARGWVDRWFWGAHAGALYYQTNRRSYYFDPTLGVHTLITKQRAALYLEFEHTFLLDPSVAAVSDPTAAEANLPAGFRDVEFENIRRLSGALVAIPLYGAFQPFAGVGVSIVQILNPKARGTVTDPELTQLIIDDAATKANLLLLAGFDLRLGRFTVFGQYKGNTEARGFLLDGAVHSLQGGFRYAIGGAREGIKDF